MLVVSKDGNGDFPTVSEALAHAVGGETIFIRNGIYSEQVEVRIPGLRIIGEDRQRTVLSGALYAMMPMPDIGKRGTFRTYTMLVDADNVDVANLTVRNEAGSGDSIGQAVALYAYGDRLSFENMDITGCMDTLFLGPLPDKERLPNGFTGPTEKEPRRRMRMFFRDCRIEGDIDFIFGGAAAYFQYCKIVQKQHASAGTGYAAAPSTPEGQEYGFVFDQCSFLSNTSCAEGSVYLGRPWRDYGKAVIMRSYIGAQCHAAGWHNWDREEAEKKCFFAEFENNGPGADMSGRPAWIHRLSPEEALAFSREQVIGF